MAVGGLKFRPRHGNTVAADAPGGVILRGEIEWIVEGTEGEIAALLAAVGSLGDRASATSALLKFGNAVGTCDLSPFGVVRVRCGKWAEEVFDALLEDLTRKFLALPFSASQIGGIPHDRSIADRDDVLLHAFLYARHILLTARRDDALPRVLDMVVRDPHRLFSAERTRVSIGAARRVDARTLARVASGSDGVIRATGLSAQIGLARALAGHLPVLVDVPRVEHTFDTAENRFVLEFIKQVRALIDRVDRLAHTKKRPFWRGIENDCQAMRRVLGPFQKHDLWIDVGRMSHVPMGSSVLQRRRGYKDVLRHYLALRAAARIPIDKDRLTSSLLGVKDVATLYELWCYFAVVEGVGQVLRRPPDSIEEYEVKIDKVAPGRGFCVKWNCGPTVHYNPTFTFTEEPPWCSASLMLRPDVVIEIERDGEVELHVFDAKLKVDGVVSLEADTGDTDDSDEDDADPLKFKREDVAKMHAYRDALPHVRSARVLYPGNVVRAFPALEPGARDIDIVGATPLIPGELPTDLVDVLETILGNGAAPMPRKTDIEIQEPAIADLAAVAAMLVDVQGLEGQTPVWSGGERGADGSIQMPFDATKITSAPAASRLLSAIYEHKLVVDFDWTAWEAEAQRFLDREVVRSASIDDIRRLLTLHVRKDRFVEGHFAQMISNGHIAHILRRLKVLVDDEVAR
jgi:uncharacterized protein